ncbi:hypothetical protein CC78DRAFT_586469 [Lojkania enalia]|uniref:Uncharacterized protein n=1 Tax=Lojkania enalia TaxID=147567 RepID=A0A9P4JYY0_9PLEO|nr:hypothetical protein CC78DRAFT_586469 [Didymosphaeria enalia]
MWRWINTACSLNYLQNQISNRDDTLNTPARPTCIAPSLSTPAARTTSYERAISFSPLNPNMPIEPLRSPKSDLKSYLLSRATNAYFRHFLASDRETTWEKYNEKCSITSIASTAVPHRP